MSSAHDADAHNAMTRRADVAWFLEHGLPWILSPRDRVRRLGLRTAPFIGAMLVLALTFWLISVLFDTSEEELDRRLEQPAWLLLLLACTLAGLILPVVVGLVVDRAADGSRGRQVVIGIYALVAVGLPIFDSVTGNHVFGMSLRSALAFCVLFCAVVLAFTYIGVGSVLAWAARFALSRLGAVGATGGRMLPVLMIVVVIYFTGELWQWAAAVDRSRVWWTILVLVVVACGFVTATTRDEFEHIIERAAEPGRSRELLVGTPFADSGRRDPAGGGAPVPLRRRETLNLLGKLLAAQVLQAVAITVAMFVFFLVLGGVMLPDRIVETWSGTAVVDSVWLGVPIPLPQAATHVSLLVAALAGLNFVVSSRSDPQYRAHYLDPLVTDVSVGLAARNAYRSSLAARSSSSDSSSSDIAGTNRTDQHPPPE